MFIVPPVHNGTECLEATRDARPIFHRRPEDFAATLNSNSCMKQTQGDCFKWLTDDNLHTLECLEKSVEILDRHLGTGLVQMLVKCIDGTGHYVKEWSFNDLDPVQHFARMMTLIYPGLAAFGFMRLGILKKVTAIATFVNSVCSLLPKPALYGQIEYALPELFLRRDHKTWSKRLITRCAKLS